MTIFQPGDLCFEIGACTGDFVQALLDLDAGKVIAVEPDGLNVATLGERFAGEPRVAIVHAGAGAAMGRATLSANSGARSCSTFVPAQAWGAGELLAGMYADRYESVPIITLDHLIELYGVPALCHITAVRYEAQILRGLSRPLPYLAFAVTHCTIRHGWANECLDRIVQVMPGARFNYTDRDVFQRDEQGNVIEHPLRWQKFAGVQRVRGILDEIDEVGLWGRIHVRGKAMGNPHKKLIRVDGWFRCGNQWLQRLLRYYLGNSVIVNAGHMMAGNYWVDARWDREPGEVCDTYVIHTQRDPRDAFVSWYYMLQLGKNSALPRRGMTFDEFLAWLPTQKHLDFRSYTEDWLKLLHFEPHNILTTSHEALFADRAGELRRLIEAMGYPVDETRIQAAAARSANESGRATYRDGGWDASQTVPCGTIGEWKRHFDAEDARLIEDAYGDLVERLGYGGDEHWAALLAEKG